MSQYDLSRPVLERLREAADIVQVVGEVVTLRKSGRNWMGLCPFHGEKTASFSVSREKGTYYCFGCKKGGDVIDFVMEIERLTFAEAVERLAGRFGVELPLASADARRRRDEGEALREALEAAQGFFARRVGEDRPRAFLEARGVSLEAATEFGLGYAPNEWRALTEALQRRLPERVLVSAGLLASSDQGRLYDRFRDRVTIPIRAVRGDLVAFGGRALGDETPKYLNSPETVLFSKGRVLFALDRAMRAFPKADRAIVVEGYFDCMAMHLAGFAETVATLGTALSEHHAKELSRKVSRVIVCFDGDAAGRAAAVSAVRTLLGADLAIAVAVLPDGQDPDDLARREGAAGVRHLLESAPEVTEFLVAQLGSGRAERRERLMGVLEIADACPNPVRRFALREELARAAGVPVEQLGGTRTAPAITVDERASALPPPGEAALLRSLLLDLPVENRREILCELPLDAVEHPAAATIVKCLRERAERGEPLEISHLASDIDDREVRRVLAALEHEVPPTGAEHLKLIMRGLWDKHRQKRLAELSLEIERAEKNQDHKQLARLLHEKSSLIRRTSSS